MNNNSVRQDRFDYQERAIKAAPMLVAVTGDGLSFDLQIVNPNEPNWLFRRELLWSQA